MKVQFILQIRLNFKLWYYCLTLYSSSLTTVTFGSIGLVVIVFAVIFFVALAIYFRRRRQCKDPEKCTGNTESDGVYEQTVSVSFPA